jgi:predicted esterase
VRTRSLILGASGLALGALGVLAWSRSPQTDVPIAPSEPEDAGIEAWCAPSLAPIAGGGCFATPPLPTTPPTTLLVYVHGRYSPKTLEDEMTRQTRVAKLGTSKGFAVLAMRGVQGECTQAELADTWCWPSNPRNAEHGPTFVKRFEPAIAAARKRLGPGPDVLLGFSNGAYFATLIATRALHHFDAIAIAHGGPVPPTEAAGATPPILLLTADEDPSDGEMRQLDQELARAKWPHELVSREGGHALPDVDVSFALTFFDRALREHLPLSPPLQAPRARRIADAGEATATTRESNDAPPAAPLEPATPKEKATPYDEDGGT